jgi:RNA polymerase sigma-70 factor (ECF subfamily)
MRDGDTAAMGQALSDWCTAYWQPIYIYLRGHGHTQEDAQDLTQGFIHSLIDGGGLTAADPERGRLRSFVLGALRRYTINAYRHATRQKRGGGAEMVSIDADAVEGRMKAEVVDELSPDRAFDRAWARSVIENVQAELGREFEARERAEQFQALVPYIVRGEGEVPFAELATRLDTTEGAARAAVTRLRKRFRTLFREHVADTLHEDSDVDDEIRELFASLQ